MSAVPAGYVRLSHEAACRCPNFKRDGDGVGWCCRPTLDLGGTGPTKPFAMSKTDHDLEVSYPFFRIAKKLGLPYGDVVRIAEGFNNEEHHPRPLAARVEAVAAAERLGGHVLRLVSERVVREAERRRAVGP